MATGNPLRQLLLKAGLVKAPMPPELACEPNKVSHAKGPFARGEIALATKRVPTHGHPQPGQSAIPQPMNTHQLVHYARRRYSPAARVMGFHKQPAQPADTHKLAYGAGREHVPAVRFVGNHDLNPVAVSLQFSAAADCRIRLMLPHSLRTMKGSDP